MSSDAHDPTDPDSRRDVLKANRDVFEQIRDDDSLDPSFRQKFGQNPLDELDRLQDGDADA